MYMCADISNCWCRSPIIFIEQNILSFDLLIRRYFTQWTKIISNFSNSSQDLNGMKCRYTYFLMWQEGKNVFLICLLIFGIIKKNIICFKVPSYSFLSRNYWLKVIIALQELMFWYLIHTSVCSFSKIAKLNATAVSGFLVYDTAFFRYNLYKIWKVCTICTWCVW